MVNLHFFAHEEGEERMTTNKTQWTATKKPRRTVAETQAARCGLREKLSPQYRTTRWTASKKRRPTTLDALCDLVGESEGKVVEALRTYYPSGRLPAGFWGEQK
jgi:hypothetical protein